MMLLPFDTEQAAQERNMIEAIRRGCDMVTTRYWWPTVDGTDGKVLNVGDGDGLSDEELARTYEVIKKIYTETPFEPWTSSFGETSPVNPRSEGWVFPANVGWEEELTARNMQWEYIEVTKDSEGLWQSVKSYAGGLWDTLKGLFS